MPAGSRYHSQAENIFHGIPACRLICAPFGSLQCAAGEHIPVQRRVRKRKRFFFRSEADFMLADYAARPPYRETDLARRPLTGNAVIRRKAYIFQINIAAISSGFAQK